MTPSPPPRSEDFPPRLAAAVSRLAPSHGSTWWFFQTEENKGVKRAWVCFLFGKRRWSAPSSASLGFRAVHHALGTFLAVLGAAVGATRQEGTP